MSLADSLLDRLKRHYVKPAAGGGIFVREIGTNDWNKAGRRCDAVYIGFTSASGKLMVGHEVKISRSDWLRELDQPNKAEFWSNACHAWYVVAPSVVVVKAEEVPPGWGLMVPNPRSTVRFDIIVKAPARDVLTFDPPWDAVRSVMARWDTLRAAQIKQAAAQQVSELRASHEKHLADLREFTASGQPTADPDATRVHDLLRRIKQAMQQAGNYMWPTDEQIIASVTDQAAAAQFASRVRQETSWRLRDLRAVTAALAPELTKLAEIYDQQNRTAVGAGEVG